MAVMHTVIETDAGTIAGRRGRRSRRGTIAWLGVPFAAPPVGELRWRAPRPVEPWSGVKSCQKYGDAPIQEKLFTLRTNGTFHPQSEDCLTLNVYAPEGVSDSPRPVMVFNYGGAYIMGGSATPIYDGSFLARARDVIVVTVNYRFGPFGFLDLTPYSTPDRQFDSNLGLRDMVAALEWVQRNIAAFGGDRDRVTVFGESAGAAAVLTLLGTPAAEGLFSGAIAQSPAADLIVHQDNARIFADEFLRLLTDPDRRSGPERTEPPLAPSYVAELVDNATARELHAAGNRLLGFTKHSGLSDPLPFAPTVDGDYLPVGPVTAAAAGKTHPVPLLLGNNASEGELFAKFWPILPEPSRVLVGLHDPEVRTELETLYPGRRDDVRLAADAAFWIPTVVFAEYHAKQAPTFLYRYDYATRLLKAAGIDATHATELLAVFGMYRHPVGAGLAAVGSWKSSKAITATVQSMWTWFARTGVPSEGWPEYDERERQVMILDVPTRVEKDPRSEVRSMWERVHKELRRW
ncbi:MAG: carboxylesterase/lipase family protein [Gordonia sp. (in: high G+C Gram-positive bacteria)]